MQQHDDHDRELGLKEPLIDWEPEKGIKGNDARRGPLFFRGLSLSRMAWKLARSRFGLQLLTIAASLSWMTASSWAILVNKHIMVGLAFRYPCTIAWLGLATTTAASATALQLRDRLLPRLARLLHTRRPKSPSAAHHHPKWALQPSLQPTTPYISIVSSSSSSSVTASTSSPPSSASTAYDPLPYSNPLSYHSLRPPAPAMTPRIYLTRVLPTGLAMALTFQLGNTGYLYLTVAFVQMLKAFCPVVTMLLLFVARLEQPGGALVGAVGLIAAGVALASYGELNMSLIGLSAMLASVVGEGVRLVLTQHLLAAGGSNLPPLEGLFYISSACTAVLTAQAALLEWPRLLLLLRGGGTAAAAAAGTGAGGGGLGAHAGGGDYLIPWAHPGSFAAAACCGFLVNMLALAVIKLASSLTLKVLGTVKDAALVSIGILFLHEHVSRLQLVGYGISMVGFVSYNLIKAKQQQQQLFYGAGGSSKQQLHGKEQQQQSSSLLRSVVSVGGGGGSSSSVGGGGRSSVLPMYASGGSSGSGLRSSVMGGSNGMAGFSGGGSIGGGMGASSSSGTVSDKAL